MQWFRAVRHCPLGAIWNPHNAVQCIVEVGIPHLDTSAYPHRVAATQHILIVESIGLSALYAGVDSSVSHDRERLIAAQERLEKLAKKRSRSVEAQNSWQAVM